MNPESKGLLLIAFGLTLVLVVGTVGLSYLVPSSAPPHSLPIPMGTVFTRNDTITWTAQFDVPALGARVVGAWTAFDGFGWPDLSVVNGTVDRPPHGVLPCQLLQSWTQIHRTIDVSVDPGPHTLFWGVCFSASRIIITETVQVAGIRILP